MPRFSANLGFLWRELSLPDAICAAAEAGFDAVECHWPYAYPAVEIADSLTKSDLTMMGLNTSPGDISAGENGLSALPGREEEARAAIDEAIAYAATVGARNVHVMAGYASGKRAHAAFISALDYASRQAEPKGITILIEPLNKYDAPGYFLETTGQAVEIIEELSRPNVKLMFDCYHVQLMEGDLTHRLESLLPLIGHIQFASVPDRGPPDEGEVSYSHIFGVLERLGYAEPLGAEYKPGGDTTGSLNWLKRGW